MHIRLHEKESYAGTPFTVRRCSLGVDGLQESRSSKQSINIFALKFEHCKLIYPIVIQRPADKDIAARECAKASASLVKQFM